MWHKGGQISRDDYKMCVATDLRQTVLPNSSVNVIMNVKDELWT